MESDCGYYREGVGETNLMDLRRSGGKSPKSESGGGFWPAVGHNRLKKYPLQLGMMI